MRSDLFDKLAYKKGYELPEKPQPYHSAMVYVYNLASTIASGRRVDLPRFLPDGLVDPNLDPDKAIKSLQAQGYAVQIVPQETEHQLALEQYEIQLASYWGHVYDLLCGPELLGIVQTDLTRILFDLAVKLAEMKGHTDSNAQCLPYIGKKFYEFCLAMQDNIKAAPGCIADDFYGMHQNLFGATYDYGNEQGFKYGLSKFWHDLEHYDPSDHPALARRFIEKIQKYNSELDRNQQKVKIPVNLLNLAMRDQENAQEKETAQVQA